MDSSEISNNYKAYDLRINKGQLPTIIIAGHLFFVDIRMDMLRPKDDFLSRGIVFSEIRNYFNEEQNSYLIPYNPKTHEFQDIDLSSIKEFPKNLIAIQFPTEDELDRIGWNRQHGYELTNNLATKDFKMLFKAEQIPWDKTFLSDLIKSNVRFDNHKEKIKKNKSKGRKM